MKNEKICIMGCSGSGKDFLLKGLIEMGEKYSPKITTRPIREGEYNGVDYIYLNNRQFEELQESNQIKVQQKFTINGNNWWYGITIENYINNNLFIMTPYELSQLSQEDRKGCFVVYLDIDEETRRNRLENRYDNNDSINRRINSDFEDFKNFVDYDLKISDPEFEIDMVWDLAF